MKPTSDASSPASGRPTLEDLLRVKRAERPDAAFWNDFERGLRQKQLASMIEPKPWWLAPLLFARRHRAALALAPAAAVAALVVVGMQGSSTGTAPASVPQLASLPAKQIEPAPAVLVEPSVANASAPSSSVETGMELALADVAPTVAPRDDLAVDAGPQPSAPVIEVAASGRPEGEPAADVVSTSLPSRPYMPGVLAELDRVAGLLASAGTHEITGLFDAMAEPADHLGELESVAFEGLNERQARLLASAGSERFIQASAVDHTGTRERVVHSLADGEELYASVSRLGMRGDRLSLKF